MALSAETRFLIDFNLHDVATALALPISADAAASMYGVTAAEIDAYQAEIDAALAATAADLGARSQTQHFLDLFQAGQTVVCMGDSITTYRYSYARVLDHLLAPRGVAVINRGYSGHTSTHALEMTYTQFLAHQPDWLFIKYGVNDCKRFGGHDAKMLVSAEEYAANLHGIIAAFQQHSEARIVVVTPTLVVEDVVNHNPDIMAQRLTWDNNDLRARGDTVLEIARETGVTAVDLRATLGNPPEMALMCDDGLHPNAAGERRMLEQIIADVK